HDAGRLAGERQQTDQDVTPTGERDQTLGPMEALDAWDPALATAPTRYLEPEHRELAGGVAAELTQPQHADTALGGRGLPQLTPDLRALLRPVGDVLAVDA